MPYRLAAGANSDHDQGDRSRVTVWVMAALQKAIDRPRLVRVCGWAVVALGVLALIGWLTGIRTLASFHAGFIPMAPNTALAFIATGFSLALLARAPHGPMRRLAQGLAALVGVLGTLRLVEYVAAVDLGVDGLVMCVSDETFGLAPVGKMAFFTAANLILAAVALLFLSRSRSAPEDGAGGAGLAVAAVGAVFTLGYVYGAPLLANQPLIPMACTTAVAFLLLGVGQVVLAGPRSFPLRPLAGNSVRAQLLRAFLPYGVVSVSVVGLFTHRLTRYAPAEHAPLLSAVLAIAAMVCIAALAAPIASRLRRKIERAEAQARRLASFPEDSPNPILEVRASGEILYANRIALQTFPDLLTAGAAHPLVDGVGVIADELGHQRRRSRLRELRVGERLYLQQASTVPEEDALRLYLSDITEQRLAEESLRDTSEQLRQAQKMEAIARLAGGVAHDFNNLLTVITGYSEMLLARPNLDPAVADSIGEIGKAGQRAASLTRQLLAFSRKQVLAPRVLDLNAVISDMDRMIRRLIGEDIGIVTHLGPGLGAVKVDPGQMEQVLLNLVVNARDAMPAGGKLTIETADVDLGVDYCKSHPEVQPGPHVMLAVSDDGCGMSSATCSRIFEPFFTTKDRDRGTGLGLSTVYGIVRQSGGSIWVYSELGIGTTFKVYLPRCFEVDAPRPAEPRTGEPEANGRETVLIIEDEPSLRPLLVEVLSAQGYEVLEAGEGEQALRVAAAYQGTIHLTIADLVMPKMGGSDVVLELARRHPTMRSLFISGYTERASRHQAMLPDSAAFLQKPFTPAALARRVREVLDAAPTAEAALLGPRSE